MFISSHQRLNPALLRLTMGLLVLLFGATGGTLWLVYELRKEQQAIAELLRVHTSEKIDSLAPFTEELRWQLVLTVGLLFVLVTAFVVLWLILRGYLQSQLSLRNLARQSRDILASMGQGVITGDCDGSIILMNREAARMLHSDFPDGDRSFAQVDDRTGLHLGEVAKTASSGQMIEDHTSRFQFADASVHLLMNAHPLRDEAGEVHGSVLHLRDVTEAELIHKRMQRMEGYMGLGPVAAGLQHEIKNPLGALALHVQLLSEELGVETSPTVKEGFDVLRAEVKRIGNVLEGFRDYANADALELEVFDLEHVILHAVKLVLPQAKEKDIKLDYNLRPEPLQLQMDATRVQQVILNLLLNALEAMKEPGRIHLELNESERAVEVVVADEGQGISQAAVPHVFEPYFTTKPQGTGMGLALCRKIARLHDGDLEFETGPDGTKFRLSLSRNLDGKS